MIADTDVIQDDLVGLARQLTSDTAVRYLQQALEDAEVLPRSAGMLGPNHKSLADKIARESAVSFERGRTRTAYRQALQMLEREHRRLSSHATILLVLFGTGILVALVLVVLGFQRHDPADYISALVTAVPSGALGLWYRYVSRKIAEIMRDMRTMAKAEQMR